MYILIYILSLYTSIGEKENGDEIYLKAKKRLDNGEILKDRNIGYVGINLNYAQFFLGEEDVEKALKYLRPALSYVDEEVKKKGYHINLYISLSQKYIMLPDYEKAKKYAGMVLKEKPKNKRALNLMGFSYSHLKKYKKAQKYGNPHAKKNIKEVKKKIEKAKKRKILEEVNQNEGEITIGNNIVEK
ncbi:MAG: tetratricopeptide repeat protein [Fusobacteriota bacterium]